MTARNESRFNRLLFCASFQRLNWYSEWISSWTMIGARENLPIISGWLHAIGALRLLISEAFSTYNFELLLTGRFNQDALEVSG